MVDQGSRGHRISLQTGYPGQQSVRRLDFNPIRVRQFLNPREMRLVVGDQNRVDRQGLRRDHGVMIADRLAALMQSRPQSTVAVGRFGVPRQSHDELQERFHQPFQPGRFGAQRETEAQFGAGDR